MFAIAPVIDDIWDYLDLTLKQRLIQALQASPATAGIANHLSRHRIKLYVRFDRKAILFDWASNLVDEVLIDEAAQLLDDFHQVDLVLVKEEVVPFAYIRHELNQLYHRYHERIRSIALHCPWPQLIDEPWSVKVSLYYNRDSAVRNPVGTEFNEILLTKELPRLNSIGCDGWFPPIHNYPGLRHVKFINIAYCDTQKLFVPPPWLEHLGMVRSSITITIESPLVELKTLLWEKNHQSVSQVLPGIPHPTSLTTTDTTITNYDHITASVTTLSLDNPRVLDLSHFTRVDTLTFNNGFQYLDVIDEAIRHHITLLTLESWDVKPEVDFARVLALFPRLKRLRLTECTVVFDTGPPHPNLEHLDIQECVTPSDAFAADLPNLRSLRLVSSFPNRDVGDLIDIERLPVLELCTVWFCNMKTISGTHHRLQKLEVCSDVDTVDINGFPNLIHIGISSANLKEITVSNPYLKSVVVKECINLQKLEVKSPQVELVDASNVLAVQELILPESVTTLVASLPLRVTTDPTTSTWMLPPLKLAILKVHANMLSKQPVQMQFSPHTTYVDLEIHAGKRPLEIEFPPQMTGLRCLFTPDNLLRFPLTYLSINLNHIKQICLPATIKHLEFRGVGVVPAIKWDGPASVRYLDLTRHNWQWDTIPIKDMPSLVYIKSQKPPQETGPVPVVSL